MVDIINQVDLTFLDEVERKYTYVVLIVLNRPIIKLMYMLIKDKIDYVICADGAANRMHDNLGVEK